MNLKYLFKLFCILCFVYQSIEMTFEYLEYKTGVEIEISDHVINGKMQPMPSLSLCKSLIPKDNNEFIRLKFTNTGEGYKSLKINCNFLENPKFECTTSYESFAELLNNQTFLSI